MGKKLICLTLLPLLFPALLPSFFRQQRRQGKRPAEIGSIREFRFRVTTASAADSYAECRLQRQDDGFALCFKPDGVPRNQAKQLKVSDAFTQKLEAFLRENSVERWNGFDRSARHAADGRGFVLSITMEDGGSLQARGYMKWPENFAAVRSGIEAIFGAAEE